MSRREKYSLDFKLEAALNERGIENVSVKNATVTKGDFTEKLSGVITPSRLDQLALRIKAATGSTN